MSVDILSLLSPKFINLFQPCPITGCWNWTGYESGVGYSGFNVGGHHSAHRYAFHTIVGPIPEGMELDHVCRNRACCNPTHLEPVTRRENQLRGNTIAAANADRTHCKRGHPYEGEHLRIIIHKASGRKMRSCKTCFRIDRKLLYEKKIGRKPLPPPSLRTHCKLGHSYSGDNLILRVSGGTQRRACRECARMLDRKRRRKP